MNELCYTCISFKRVGVVVLEKSMRMCEAETSLFSKTGEQFFNFVLCGLLLTKTRWIKLQPSKLL